VPKNDFILLSFVKFDAKVVILVKSANKFAEKVVKKSPLMLICYKKRPKYLNFERFCFVLLNFAIADNLLISFCHI